MEKQTNQTNQTTETQTRVLNNTIRAFMTYTVETRADTTKTKTLMGTAEMTTLRKQTKH